ncbi:MAG: leucine-rich repeat protein [Clostridia bacterium]|nr:leucine-rich repeat protein [Clostridia bacterium]
MKKKLLLILSMVALLVCLLAITAGATKIGDFEYSLNKETQEATFGDNRSYTGSTVYIPSTVEHEGVTYTVTAISGNALNNNDNVVTLYIPSTVTQLLGGTFCSCDGLTSVYVDTENLTYIGQCGMSYNYSDRDSVLGSNVISYYPTSEYGKENPQRTLDMKLENLTYLGVGSLQGLYVNCLVLGGKLTVIPKQLLRGSTFTTLTIKGEVTEICDWLTPGCANLTTVVIESRSLEKLGVSLFSGVKTITSMTIDLSNVTEIGGAAFRFSGDRHVTSPNVQWFNPDGEKIVNLSSLQKISSQAFAGSNVGSARIIWPTGMTASNMGDNNDSSTFRNAGITGTIYIDAVAGTNLAIDTWCFRDNAYDTVVFGPNVTKVGSLFAGVKTLKTVIFLADSVEVTSSDLFKDCSGINFYFKSLTTNTQFSQANEIQITSGTYNNYGVCGFIASVVTADGTVTVGEANHTTSGAINNALCPVGKVTETTCKYCDYVAYSVDGEAVERKEHEYSLVGSIVYENYFAMGFKTTKCECGDEQASENATENALFVWKGFSVSEQADANGCYSVTQGFYVDMEAIKAYAAIKTDFAFGVVASVGKENPISIVDGAVVADSNVIFAPISRNSNGELSVVHNYFDIKVTGIDENNLSTQIAFNGYVVDGGEIYYLHAGEMSETAVGSSYNEVI